MTLTELAADKSRLIMLDHNSPQFRFGFLCMQDEKMRGEILKHLKVYTAQELIAKFMEK